MVNDRNIRTVRYFASQNGDDLYRCKETGGVFVRQKCDEQYVRWMTTSKWQGGYEADCPLQENIVIHVVDRGGSMLFQETVIRVDGYMDTVAENAGAFKDVAIAGFAEEIMKRYDLASYDEWKSWLMKEAEATGFDGYYDNWLYDAEYDAPAKIAQMDFLGISVYAITQKAKHRKCSKTWTSYEIRTADLSTCIAICGFDFEKEEA